MSTLTVIIFLTGIVAYFWSRYKRSIKKRSKYVWDYEFPASIYAKISARYPLLSDAVMAKGIKMHNDWNKSELLTERSIEAYENDRTSKSKFDKHFKKYKLCLGTVYIVYLWVIFIPSDIRTIIYVSNISIIIFFCFIVVLAICIGRAHDIKKRDTPAICSRCQNIMCRHPYTDEVSAHDSNGIVYLCHSCSTKFIFQRPSTFCSAA